MKNGVFDGCPAVGEERRLPQELVHSAVLRQQCARSDAMRAEAVASRRADRAHRAAGNVDGQRDMPRVVRDSVLPQNAHYVTEAT